MPACTLCCLQSTINIMPYDKKHICLPINSKKKQRPRYQLSLKTRSRQKRRRSWLRGQGIPTTFRIVLSVNPCLLKKKVIVFLQNLSNSHWMVTFFSTQAALTKTQSTDLDYKHASSISVAWIQLDQEAPKSLRDFCGFWIWHSVMQIAELWTGSVLFKWIGIRPLEQNCKVACLAQRLSHRSN